MARQNHNIPHNALSTDVDVAIRLRRAINLNDGVLVKRIIKNNPSKLKNPDLNDNGNTSLHLAAQLGFLEIVQSLVDFGHEDDAPSRNVSWDTPLHLAVETSVPIAAFLATRFPQCIPWKNKQGADAVRCPYSPLAQEQLRYSATTDALHSVQVMLSARKAPALPPPAPNIATSPSSPPSSHPPLPTQTPQLLLSTLLHLSPIPTRVLLTAADLDGNTALHYASAYGQLKAIRVLLAAGAIPGAKNNYSWTPVAYSSTVQAEVYFKGLVGGVNESGGAGAGAGVVSGSGVGAGPRREGESAGASRGGGGSGLRIVRTGEEMSSGMEMRGGDGRRRAGSAE
ncbi:MAG: hypothetical protein Q9169_000655 [Polycauliona sp. 2 TL-2023]